MVEYTDITSNADLIVSILHKMKPLEKCLTTNKGVIVTYSYNYSKYLIITNSRGIITYIGIIKDYFL